MAVVEAEALGSSLTIVGVGVSIEVEPEVKLELLPEGAVIASAKFGVPSAPVN